MPLKENLKKLAIKKVFQFLPKIPQRIRNRLIGKIVSEIERRRIHNVEQIFGLIKRFTQIVNKNCQEKFLENFVLKGLIENEKIRRKLINQGLPTLYSVLISPTMRCNLNCLGCYAKNYQKKDDLPFEIIDRVLKEGKEMKVLIFTILGGEPFLRKDLFDLYKKHSDCYFQVYTNSTLINEEIAQKLVDCGNVLVQFSIEGFKEKTDNRRGKGIFEKTMQAMDILRKYGVPFGYSVCVTRKNVEEVMSDQFIKLMIEKGALIGWHFLYMPVCGDKNTELMPTPEQRNFMRQRRDYIKSNYPIFIIDFWNDAPFVGGCISAKYYCHINNFGDVEPCIFTHFAQVNIKNTTLKEALNCQLFKEIRARQPFNKNLYLPCPLIDNPWAIRNIYKICHPYPTHPGAQTLFEDINEEIDKYSQGVHQVYKKVWQEWEEENEEKIEKRVSPRLILENVLRLAKINKH